MTQTAGVGHNTLCPPRGTLVCHCHITVELHWIYFFRRYKLHHIIRIYPCVCITAEMWFGILFAILVESVPMSVRSTTVGAFLFWMNNFGGNVPMFVEPVRKAYDYKTALAIFYAGFYLLSKSKLFTIGNITYTRVCYEEKTPRQIICTTTDIHS